MKCCRPSPGLSSRRPTRGRATRRCPILLRTTDEVLEEGHPAQERQRLVSLPTIATRTGQGVNPCPVFRFLVTLQPVSGSHGDCWGAVGTISDKLGNCWGTSW